jgi:hypothetical protein
MQKLDVIVPATVLIEYLSKAQFCTGSGQPISKPIWIDLSDWDIYVVSCASENFHSKI